MYKNDRVTRRYSEPFKLKILDELSAGNTSEVIVISRFIAHTPVCRNLSHYRKPRLISRIM